MASKQTTATIKILTARLSADGTTKVLYEVKGYSDGCITFTNIPQMTKAVLYTEDKPKNAEGTGFIVRGVAKVAGQEDKKTLALALRAAGDAGRIEFDRELITGVKSRLFV